MEIKRGDNLDLRRRMLGITPEERKRLSINKSTLWYQQKHIQEGRRIKVYGKIMEKLRQGAK